METVVDSDGTEVGAAAAAGGVGAGSDGTEVGATAAAGGVGDGSEEEHARATAIAVRNIAHMAYLIIVASGSNVTVLSWRRNDAPMGFCR